MLKISEQFNHVSRLQGHHFSEWRQRPHQMMNELDVFNQLHFLQVVSPFGPTKSQQRNKPKALIVFKWPLSADSFGVRCPG